MLPARAIDCTDRPCRKKFPQFRIPPGSPDKHSQDAASVGVDRVDVWVVEVLSYNNHFSIWPQVVVGPHAPANVQRAQPECVVAGWISLSRRQAGDQFCDDELRLPRPDHAKALLPHPLADSQLIALSA